MYAGFVLSSAGMGTISSQIRASKLEGGGVWGSRDGCASWGYCLFWGSVLGAGDLAFSVEVGKNLGDTKGRRAVVNHH